MNIKFPLTVIAVVLFFPLAIFLPDAAGARGRGGGRHSRSGPASSGGFSSRSSARRAPTRKPAARKPATRKAPARQNARTQRPEKRQDVRGERTDRRQDVRGERTDRRQDVRGERTDRRQDVIDDRRDYLDNVREDRQDFVEDRWDDYYRYHRRAAFATGVAVGAVASSNYVTTLSCAPTIVVANAVTYYRCGSTWYTRGNVSGEVVYIIATAPAGY